MPKNGHKSHTPSPGSKSGHRSHTPSPSSKSKHKSKKHKEKEKKGEKEKETQPGFWAGITTRFLHVKDKWHSSPLLDQFKSDNVVQLVNRVTKKALRVTDFGEIDCRGERSAEHDEQLHFIVTNHGSNIISMKSLTFPLSTDKYLRVKSDGKLYCNGNGKTDDCKFRLHETEDNWVTFESFQFMYHHIAAKEDGSLVAPKKVWDKTKACHFDVKMIGQHRKTPAGWKVIQMDG